MSSATLSHAAARPGYGFRTVAAMEWRKLRTVRSTWYILALFTASMIILAMLVLIGLGRGAFVRHTAGAICALVGVLFVLPLLFFSPSLQNTAQNFLPHPMANSLTAVKPLPHALPAGATFALLCAYTVAVLAAGAWALARKDA